MFFALVYKKIWPIKELYIWAVLYWSRYIKLVIQCRHCHALAENETLNSHLIEKCPYCGGFFAWETGD